MSVTQIGGVKRLEFLPVGDEFNERLRSVVPYDPEAVSSLTLASHVPIPEELQDQAHGNMLRMEPDVSVVLDHEKLVLQLQFHLAALGLREAGIGIENFRPSRVPLVSRPITLRSVEDLGFMNLKVTELTRRIRFVSHGDCDQRPLPLVEFNGVRAESVRL